MIVQVFHHLIANYFLKDAENTAVCSKMQFLEGNF